MGGKDGEVKIWINPLDSEARQRFTLAHELGHYVNDMLLKGNMEIKDTPDTLYRDGTSDAREAKANNFAAMLLMPTNEVFSKARELIESTTNQSIPVKGFTEKMAEQFAVSKTAMFVRLKVLGLIVAR